MFHRVAFGGRERVAFLDAERGADFGFGDFAESVEVEDADFGGLGAQCDGEAQEEGVLHLVYGRVSLL